MEFNPDKCEVFRLYRKKETSYLPIHTSWHHPQNHRKRRIHVSRGFYQYSKLNWSSHINTITNKAKNSMRFIRQNVKTQNKQLKEAAYRTFVRPQVEYCSTAWHPWQKHLTHRIEIVQRSAARYVQNDYHYTSSVTNMLRELKWSTLEQRRNLIKPVSQCYKKYITNRSMSITVISQHETITVM